jgi:hypothetical protein
MANDEVATGKYDRGFQGAGRGVAFGKLQPTDKITRWPARRSGFGGGIQWSKMKATHNDTSAARLGPNLNQLVVTSQSERRYGDRVLRCLGDTGSASRGCRQPAALGGTGGRDQ